MGTRVKNGEGFGCGGGLLSFVSPLVSVSSGISVVKRGMVMCFRAGLGILETFFCLLLLLLLLQLCFFFVVFFALSPWCWREDGSACKVGGRVWSGCGDWCWCKTIWLY